VGRVAKAELLNRTAPRGRVVPLSRGIAGDAWVGQFVAVGGLLFAYVAVGVLFAYVAVGGLLFAYVAVGILLLIVAVVVAFAGAAVAAGYIFLNCFGGVVSPVVNSTNGEFDG
jgi:apolipoprotein N-acyltransferase